MAVNSDLFIAGVLPPYSFLFLPLYTALFMADPAIRDFRAGIDPLIFSKPVTRAEYLLGKFFGNFFVLACCQAAFVLTLFVLQWVPKQGVTTLQETKFLAYPRHYLPYVFGRGLLYRRHSYAKRQIRVRAGNRFLSNLRYLSNDSIEQLAMAMETRS
jgi:hypothetical protein